MTNATATVKDTFPLLDNRSAEEPLVYLDSAATSQTPQSVIDALTGYYTDHRASVHRGVYPLAVQTTNLFESARHKIAAFTGSSPEETIFTRNATEAINLVAYSWGRANIGAGDLVVVSEMEHHSNLVPWQVLTQAAGAELAYIPIDDEGELRLDVLDELLERGPKLVAFAHISNVLGTINPVEEITRRAHGSGAKVLVDGAQAVPHISVNVSAIDADFYVWTGHKAYGPTGIGVLHGRRELLEKMEPFITGGHMISRVGLAQSSWADLPAKFEAGTSPIAEVIGLGAAIDFLADLGMEHVQSHGDQITKYAQAGLSEIAGLRLLGPADVARRAPICAFSLTGAHPHDVAEILGRENICVRAGHHCAQVLMRRLGVHATTRASFGIYNTPGDVDRLISGLGTVRRVLQL